MRSGGSVIVDAPDNNRRRARPRQHSPDTETCHTSRRTAAGNRTAALTADHSGTALPSAADPSAARAPRCRPASGAILPSAASAHDCHDGEPQQNAKRGSGAHHHQHEAVHPPREHEPLARVPPAETLLAELAEHTAVAVFADVSQGTFPVRRAQAYQIAAGRDPHVHQERPRTSGCRKRGCACTRPHTQNDSMILSGGPTNVMNTSGCVCVSSACRRTLSTSHHFSGPPHIRRTTSPASRSHARRRIMMLSLAARGV